MAQRYKEQGLVYSPAGALTRTEADLTSEHFDSLAVIGLLPGKAVAVGDTWKIANPIVQALCSFEGVTEHSLAGKLDDVKNDIAYFSISGKAAGIDLGASVKMDITAKGQFDLKTKHLIALAWTQKDQRDAGPVSPATAVTTTNTLKRTAIEQPARLSDVALVSVPDNFTPPALVTQLELRDAKDRYELLHPREWHIVSATPEHQVLRLMDRGDFIAQATITSWTAADKGKHLSPDEFRPRCTNRRVSPCRRNCRPAKCRARRRSLGVSSVGAGGTGWRRGDAELLSDCGAERRTGGSDVHDDAEAGRETGAARFVVRRQHGSAGGEEVSCPF